MSNWIRIIHRWLGVVFTLAVMANFAAMAAGHNPPPDWITYSPLLPLALMWLSGMYLLVLPWAARWRRGRPTSTKATG